MTHGRHDLRFQDRSVRLSSQRCGRWGKLCIRSQLCGVIHVEPPLSAIALLGQSNKTTPAQPSALLVRFRD